MEFTTCSVELMPEEALTSFTISDAYRQFAGQSQLFKSKCRCIEYLMPTNNIIVLDSCFTLTHKSNPIDNFLIILQQLTFLGHPVCISAHVVKISLFFIIRFELKYRRGGCQGDTSFTGVFTIGPLGPCSPSPFGPSTEKNVAN